jgi:hypothetical protein
MVKGRCPYTRRGMAFSAEQKLSCTRALLELTTSDDRETTPLTCSCRHTGTACNQSVSRHVRNLTGHHNHVIVRCTTGYPPSCMSHNSVRRNGVTSGFSCVRLSARASARVFLRSSVPPSLRPNGSMAQQREPTLWACPLCHCCSLQILCFSFHVASKDAVKVEYLRVT